MKKNLRNKWIALVLVVACAIPAYAFAESKIANQTMDDEAKVIIAQDNLDAYEITTCDRKVSYKIIPQEFNYSSKYNETTLKVRVDWKWNSTPSVKYKDAVACNVLDTDFSVESVSGKVYYGYSSDGKVLKQKDLIIEKGKDNSVYSTFPVSVFHRDNIHIRPMSVIGYNGFIDVTYKAPGKITQTELTAGYHHFQWL